MNTLLRSALALLLSPLCVPAIGGTEQSCLDSVYAFNQDTGAGFPLAVSGPISIYPLPAEDETIHLEVRFCEPIRAIRNITTSIGACRWKISDADAAQVLLSITGVEDASHVRLEFSDVLLESGHREFKYLQFGTLQGDYTGDGAITPDDLVEFGRLYNEGNPLADLNGDEAISEKDSATLAKALSENRRLKDMPPHIKGPSSVFVPRGGEPVRIEFIIQDDLRSVDDLSIAVQNTSELSADLLDVSFTREGDTGVVEIAAAQSAIDIATLEFAVSDGTTSSLMPIHMMVIENGPPDARITAVPHLGIAPLSVDFSSSRTVDEQIDNLSFDWNFAGFGSATGAEASFTFNTPGDHIVTLTATDPNGAVNTHSVVITVAAQAWMPSQQETEREAKRFLWQAAFGPEQKDLRFIQRRGFEAWIDIQISKRPTLFTKRLAKSRPLHLSGVSDRKRRDLEKYGAEMDLVAGDMFVAAKDQLRQRMAWALLQVIPINGYRALSGSRESDRDRYYVYNTYLRNALPHRRVRSRGNYFDLIHELTFNSAMAEWLTYKNNKKADPESGTSPDENYAREVMQLFTIGLHMLAPNGQPLLDPFGEPIPTYDNEDVKQFARVFTGMKDPEWKSGLPTVWNIWTHEFGEKQLLQYPGSIPLNGYIPARESSDRTELAAAQDVSLTLKNLFNHPSHAPFLAKLMIQRFTTSNPTPGYVRRVADAYQGQAPFGEGERGDLAAMMKAILLDDEARNPAYRSNPHYGVVLEPVRVLSGTARALKIYKKKNKLPSADLDLGDDYYDATRQAFFQTPSVFNFYLPTYSPIGSEIDRAGFVSPELQIYDDMTAVAGFDETIEQLVYSAEDIEPKFLKQARAFSGEPRTLAEHFANALDHGWVTEDAITELETALTTISNPEDRVAAGFYLTVGNPRFRVLR